MTSSRLQELVELNNIPNWRLTAWLVMLLLIFFLIWASFLTIREVAVASGIFLSPSGLEKISHSEGGIVEGIHVSDGQVINEDAPLILIKTADHGNNSNKLKVQLDKLSLTKIRLEAEVKGKDTLIYPENLVKRLHEEVILQRQKFDAGRLQLESSTSSLIQKIKSARSELSDLEAQVRAVANNLRMGNKRFEMSRNLLNEGLIVETEHLQIEAEIQRLKEQAQILKSSLPQAKEAVVDAETQIKVMRNQFQSAAEEELFKTEKKIEGIERMLASSDEEGMRTMIRSPIDGTVKNLLYDTVGEIVSPGETIMEIVPAEASLVVEARLKPEDRPFVALNQLATVKLSAYDFVRFGVLKGHVTMVAPVASISENGVSFFKVLVQTNKSFLGEDPMLFKVSPGMLATVEIHTGEKSLMEYLIMPVLQLNHKAFRER